MKKKLGARLRHAREAAGVSQTEVAATLGLRQQQISRWENDEEIPHDRHRRRLAKLIEVELADLQEWIADTHEAQAREARLEVRRARSELDDALSQVKQFVDTYQDFHAAYQKIGAQVDQLVEEIAEIKRIVLRRNNSQPGRS